MKIVVVALLTYHTNGSLQTVSETCPFSCMRVLSHWSHTKMYAAMFEEDVKLACFKHALGMSADHFVIMSAANAVYFS